MKSHIGIFIILLFSLIFFQRCSKDNPTEPTEKPKKVLASSTIGSNGGTIKTDDIEITIPANTFQANSELKILELTEDNSFGVNGISDFFVLDGLPNEFSKSIQIKIRYSGSITDSSFIALGEHNFISSLNEETISYHLINAKDSAGYLIAEIPPIINQGLGKNTDNYSENADNLSINLGAIAGYVSYLSPQKHFIINTPSSVLTQAYDLADYLETAYSKFKSIGFSYSHRTKWPIDVTIKRLSTSQSDVFGYTINSMWGNNYGYMQFNFDKIDDAGNMKVTAGHEFFHLVQSLYDPRYGYSKAKSPMPNYWLDEASSVWSEAFFSSAANYVSPIFSDNVFDVFKGAKTGNDKSQSEQYGYGMASFIKYITKKYGNSKLVEVYNNIYSGDKPFTALSKVLPVSVGFSWHSYLKSLLTFDLYSSDTFRPGLLIAYSSGEHQKFIIKSASDSLATYKSKLSDCSATIFSVDNQFKDMSSNAILKFTCKDWKFQLYKINSNTSELIESGKDILTVSNFKQLTDKGYKIIAVLYNDDYDFPFEHSKEYEMEIRLKTLVKIKTIDIRVSYTGTFNETYPDTIYNFHHERTIEGIYNGGDFAISGNTITATTKTTKGVYNQTSNISVSFDDITNPTQVLQFSINNDALDTFVHAIIKESAVGQDVPFSYSHRDKIYQFTYYGNISNYLSSLTHTNTRSEKFTRADGSTFTADVIYKLISYDSQGSIGITLEFE